MSYFRKDGYFTTSYEVEQFLPRVFLVHFRKDIVSLGYTKGAPDGMRIEIKTSGRFRPEKTPWETTDLEEQQVTLLHELCHVQDMATGRQRAWSRLLPHPHFDEHVYGLLKACPEIVDEIMYRFMKRGTEFHYDEETPFLEYHRELVRRYLRAGSSPVLLLAPIRSRMMRYAEQLEIPVRCKFSRGSRA